ncbi:MAG TPA: PilZ domain-containing protein [Tepidisphaeraceae bacterium]|nr:PilZ domain-containing protein [Tepidisphaeraceae bacterium]
MTPTMTYSSGKDQRIMRMERRRYRRHDVEQQGVNLLSADFKTAADGPIGTIVDLSAGGVRIRCRDANLKPDSQIRVRLQLPVYAGISPFVADGSVRGRNDWIGWLNVRRVIKTTDGVEVAGELMDMDEVDRGMLGLYLSTQPLAA